MGDLELLVPRSRKGGFQPKLLKRYARRVRSIDKVMLACFCLGLSTRKAASVLAPMLGERVSASTISRIAKDLDHEVKAYHSRSLQDHYRFLFFGGVVLKNKGAAKVQKKILLCAFGHHLGGQARVDRFSPGHKRIHCCLGSTLERSVPARSQSQRL